MKSRISSGVIAFGLSGLAILLESGCTVVPKAKLEPASHAMKVHPPAPVKVLVLGFDKPEGEAIRQDIKAYFDETDAFKVVLESQSVGDKQRQELMEQYHADLILLGDNYLAGCTSDATDRAGVIWYLTAFIITSPIAIGMATGSEWNASAFAKARMRVLSTRTDKEIWNRNMDVLIKEKGKVVVGKHKVAAALVPIARRNLVTRMLDEFSAGYTPGN